MAESGICATPQEVTGIATHPTRLVYDCAEAAEALGVSRASIYAAVKTGAIHSFRLNRRVLIPKAALERLLEGPAEEIGRQNRAQTA